jgi:hypothetical protein
MQEVEHMLRTLTITTTLALALLGIAGCGSTAKQAEEPITAPTDPDPESDPVQAEPCVEPDSPSATIPGTAPQPCPDEPHDPEVCTSGPDDKRCPEHQ